MIKYPDINPIAFHLGPVPVFWYGLMYLISFTAAWGLLQLRIKNTQAPFTASALSDILFYSALGVILGGRLGYVLFYDWSYFITHPWFLIQTWKGGMSFHGGLIGVILALWIYAKKHRLSLLTLTDFVAPVVPFGLGAGRIGNFINGELWGRVTEMPWGMIFPSGGNTPRHPSQFYEFFLEGVLLFIVLWVYSNRNPPRGAVSGLFLFLYGCFRFSIEFFREPDPQLGFIAFHWVTQGQLFSLPMILIGMGLLLWAYRRGEKS